MATPVDWMHTEAALFDLDGVLTPTAEVHMRAWSKMFNAYLLEKGIEAPYTDEDYFAHVDGKPRYEGVRDFLASRGLTLPAGDPGDAPERETVCGLGNRKNDVFAEVLATEGVAAFPGSVALLDHLAGAGVAVAVVSSSQNAVPVLEAAGLRSRFDVVVDGVVAARDGLPGKPRPDTFVRAAELLGAGVAASVVLEDALSGVRAGRTGGFGHVVGVDRGVGARQLEEAGADVVVADLAELVPTTGPSDRRS